MTPAEASVTPPPSRGDLLVEAIRRLAVHDHLCLIYDSEEERLRTLLPFFAAGLERGERCVYIADGETAAGGLDLLQGLGADVPRSIASGQLQVLTKRDAYLRHGMFDPDSMIELLADTVRQARADGYSGLRVTGEMTWALRGEPGSERLIEYESKLNRFFPRADVVAICQYDRRWFRPELIKEVIETHPLVIHGDRVCRNFYYVPPEEFLGAQAPEHEVQRLLDNIAARERQEEALRAAEARFRRLWDSGIVGVIEADLEGRVLGANDAFLDMVGYTRTELEKGELRWDCITPPEHMARTAQSVSDLRRTGLSSAYEKQYLRKDGRPVWVMIGSASLEGPTQRALAFVVDVDARKRAEAELRRVERALRAVVACQQTLVRAADEVVLMTEVCRLLVDVGGYRMAWAGYAEDDDERSIRPVAHSGFDSGYVETMNLSWSEAGRRGRGPTARAIRTGARQVVPDLESEPSYGPWRDQALRRGYRSSAAFPLRVGERVVGALNVYAELPDAFDLEELALLDQLAADLSFGISVLRDAESRRRQERQLDAFFAHTITPLVFLDPQFNFVRVNEAYARVCARPIADFAGRNHFDLYPSDARPAFEEVVRTKKPCAVQARPFEFADHPEWGVTFWDWSLVPVLDEAGEVEFLVFSLNDVTARTRAEQGRARLAAILESTSDLVGTARPDGRIETLNAAGRALAGIAPDEDVTALRMADLHPEWSRRLVLEEALPAAARDGLWRGETALLAKDGREVPLSQVVIAHRRSSGEVEYFSTIARDVTEAKRTEDLLREAHRYTRGLIEASLDALATIDPAGAITDVNERMCQMTGRPRAELVGAPFRECFTDTARAAEGVQRVLSDGLVSDYELAVRTPGGPVPVSYNATVFRGPDGRVQGVFAAARDRTEALRAEALLREAHRYTRGLIEASVDALATIDPAGAITDVNERMCQVTGRTRDELVGSPFRDRFLDADRAAEGVRRVLVEGSVLDYELALRGPDGVLPVSYNATVYRGPDGGVTGVFAAARDITERKRAEEALARRARQQAAVAELGAQALAADGIEEVMDAAARLLASRLEVEFATVLELVPGGRELVLRAGFGWREGLVGQATVTADPASHAGYTLARTEAVVVDDLASEERFPVMPLLRDHGVASGLGVVVGSPESPSGLLGAYSRARRRFTEDDVNFTRAVANVLGTALERHRARRATEREAALVRMLQAAAVAANEADSVEEAARRMLAHVCEETGWPVGHLFHVHRHPEPVAVSSSLWYLSDPRYEVLRRATEGVTVPTGFGLVGRVLDAGAPQWSDDAPTQVLPARVSAIRGTGLRSWMAFPVLTRTSEVVAVAEFFSPERLQPDLRLLEAVGHVGTQLGRVVERQRAEERLARYARDLERSNQDLQEFASVASHDMQEPLRKVVAFGDRLAEHAAGALDATALDDLRRMQAAAGRMSTLIESLLELSRVSTRAKAVEPTDLRAVMTEVLADLEERIRSTAARVDVGALPSIQADAAQMRQLLQNLVSNALKFVARGTPPDVRVAARSAPGGFVEIAVTDNGIGFEERYLDRIFRPFQTLNPRGDYEGSGMGLAICRKIAERHGGSITARSRPGQGSTFVVSLPVRRSEEAR